MFAGHHTARGARRGVILLVVLGMLGLLALIGVTFATFSTQARISALKFSQSQNFPDNTEVMDFALSQLIDDTFNPLSAIRGHSLKRDMYGNDANFNGYLTGRPDNGAPIAFTSVASSPVSSGPLTGTYACVMNVSNTDPAFAGYYDFTRWIVRFPATPNYGNPLPSTIPGFPVSYPYMVSETFEVVYDDYTGSTGVSTSNRVLFLTPHDSSVGITGYTSGSTVPAPSPPTTNGRAFLTQSALIGAPSGVGFVLDGRYLRAFNGPGLSAPVSYSNGSSMVTNPANVYGNFRVNGPLLGSPFAPLGDPDAVGMDEDYDACDLDNWFLAIQSADGQTVIPSFHRPAIIRADPSDANNPPNNGNVTFNGATDWNDFRGNNPNAFDSKSRILRPRMFDGHSSLSFPDLLPGSNGRITYDVDNDGDGVTDSVWLDLGYPAKRDPTGQLYKPLYAFLIVGLNGRIPLNTAGNLQDVNFTTSGALGSESVTTNTTYHSSSHLGYSPSEIDPTYALQNAADSTGTLYSQQDNAGVRVALTQLRNILAGTRPQDSLTSPSGVNGDLNFVAVNGQPWYVPNGQADQNVLVGNPDTFNCQDANGNAAVCRNFPAVPGRWGEGDYVPSLLSSTNTGYRTTIGPGLSLGYSPGNSVGIEDDNFTSFDPTGQATDFLDYTGSIQLASERIRRFGAPIDLTGNGLVAPYNVVYGSSGGVPALQGTGTGPDAFGRVMFQGYFRPGGRPTIVGNQPPLAIGAADLTTNPLHGYDALRHPLITVGGDKTLIAAYGTRSVGGGGGGKGVRLGQNEADEMRLYPPGNEYDAPFDATDLQWLYRLQDSDGPTLTSRLSSLAPISFLNPKDGARRRRLFGLDTWDTTNFAWAPDNPLGAFPDNSRFGVFANQFTTGNSGAPVYVPVTANASFANLNLTSGEISNALSNGFKYPFGYFSPLYNVNNNTIPVGYGPFSAYGPANTGSAISPDPTHSWPAPTPQLAQRDRKINLNYPLPVSNDPNEPIRQKWISEAYYMLKSILPPQSVDTPAECAKLSQFVINIVDFRDPDGTATHWVNPDIRIVPPYVDTNTTPATPYMPQVVFAGYTTLNTAGGEPPAVALDQYGMEYLPVAINEVLAYSFPRKDYDAGATAPISRPTNRFFVELVNTLTQSSSSPNSTPATPDASDAFSSGATAGTVGLDLTHWDMVVAEDDVYGRPDPTSGQLLTAPNTVNEVYGPVPITAPGAASLGSFINYNPGSGGTVQPTTSPTFPTPTTATSQYINIPAVGINNGTTQNPSQIAPAISGSTQPIGAGSTKAANNNAPQWPWAQQPSGTGTAPYPATAPNQSAYNYYHVIGNLLPVIPVHTSSTPTDSTRPDYTGNAASAAGGGTGNACENNPPLLINPIPDQIMTLIDGQTAKASTNSLPETDLFDSPYSGATLSNSGQTATGSGTTQSPYSLINSGLYPIPQITPGSGKTKYMWLYLRRPANPFAPSGPGNPMVVVDCMRFAYIESGGAATGDPANGGKLDPNGYTKDNVTVGANQIYSIQRLQPFRGGHAVSSQMLVGTNTVTAAYGYDGTGATPLTANGLIPAYGYAEQTLPAPAPTANPNTEGNYGIFGNARVTQYIRETLGAANSTVEPWDYFPFNDRDFMSVAELTMVPGCPPGLFTKQFVENAPLNFTVAATAPQITPPTGGTYPNEGRLVTGTTAPLVPHVYPYLVDNFFYTAGSPALLNPIANQTGGTGPVWPRTGGPSGAGWHKMFEFFEVPSPANGAIDAVANGMNYDWARQDTRPGLLNLNLIIDEEVWLGLMGNLGLPNDSRNTTSIPMMNSAQIVNPSKYDSNGDSAPEFGTPLQNLDINGAMTPTPTPLAPHVVTLTDLTGSPYAFNNTQLMTYPMSNIGFFTADANPTTPQTPDSRMKAAFSDFLKLRHGGSGYIFAWGTGPVGNVPGLPTGVGASATVQGGQGSPAAERPFRTPSFPDIDYTVMRPAALPPPPSGAIPAPNPFATPLPLQATTRTGLAAGALYWDPGVKDPYASYPYTPSATNVTATNGAADTYPVALPNAFNTAQIYEPPDIPPRRLFEIPDAYDGTGGAGASNASLAGSGRNIYVPDLMLTAPGFDLTAGTTVYLGNATAAAPFDNRQHPYFRTEWLQKVMNLTTVRTHQYAVWITVAFFEVSKQGDPSLAGDPNNFTGAMDILGDELNVSTGRAVRFRSFFLLDRTRAVGFNPATPGDFRNVVVYRQTIE